MSQFVAQFNPAIKTITSFSMEEPQFEQSRPGNNRVNNRNRQKALQMFAIGFTVDTILLGRETLPYVADYTIIEALDDNS